MQRWVLARLRHRRFFSLAELNDAIRELIADLNNRPMRHLGTTRRVLFEAIESDTPLDLPAEAFAYAEWRRCRAGLDYHVEVYGHFYSVPYRLMREVIDARITNQTVELFHSNERIACHVRNGISRGPHEPQSAVSHQSRYSATLAAKIIVCAFRWEVFEAIKSSWNSCLIDESGFRTLRDGYQPEQY